MNVKVFNLISGVIEIRLLVQHESCECKCGLNRKECNSKQKWNHDKRQFECKELDDLSSRKKGYIWNPDTCGCECNTTWQVENI